MTTRAAIGTWANVKRCDSTCMSSPEECALRAEDLRQERHSLAKANGVQRALQRVARARARACDRLGTVSCRTPPTPPAVRPFPSSRALRSSCSRHSSCCGSKGATCAATRGPTSPWRLPGARFRPRLRGSRSRLGRGSPGRGRRADSAAHRPGARLLEAGALPAARGAVRRALRRLGCGAARISSCCSWRSRWRGPFSSGWGSGAAARDTLLTFVATGIVVPYVAWRMTESLQVALALAGLVLALSRCALRGAPRSAGRRRWAERLLAQPWADLLGGALSAC